MPFLMFYRVVLALIIGGEKRAENDEAKSLTSGSSSQSERLSAGKMTSVAPARRAATVFSRRPPIRKTLPVTVSSPVMAMAGSRGWFSAKESRELAMVIPAEGPIDELLVIEQ